MLIVLLISLVIGSLGIGLYLQQPKFGKLPDGPYLERIKSSPNYVDGQFQNLVPTPRLAEETSSASMLWHFLFAKKARLAPTEDIPSVKTDLLALDQSQDVVISLGHSSYFVQLGGKRMLIDPVFSHYAAPVSFANRAFAGTNPYTADDMPEIDYLIISHDHWDHLDYPTSITLKPKVKYVVCPLGVGAYFEQWGFEEKRIQEADWFNAVEIEKDLTIYVLPARHFSGRLLTENKTLWAGFALVTPERRIFYSGDGGYGPHFKKIGEMFSGFDLAIMENGQYDKRWPYIHMMPEEVSQAAEEVGAKVVLPAHSGKFSLANHAWDEPLKRITLASQNRKYRLITPKIGEKVEIENQQQIFSHWWEGIN
ncbi:metallo-beta-lactamase [Lucifera butyrica]|uniref:Metallo-beta-lactamase n=1 Tax=Lucifera butyrica TaxID=1351585 RepID=A0A498RCG8_9FIRM|nr:MBL fold metallo-hydrolase [Lucifera butyrica]VBB08607.1 metallo-beta-lactamase [Lucifera butyrica]